MGLELGAFVFGLALLVGVVSGLAGIGGGIVMAPALLFLPPIFGLPELAMRDVAGLTLVQSLFAGLSGAVAHHRSGHVDRRLVVAMGSVMAVSALGGAIASNAVSNETLETLFAALAVAAAVLMSLPGQEGSPETEGTKARAGLRSKPNKRPSLLVAVLISLGVGSLGGLVGQGGSFLLIPLMLHVLRVETRVVVGTNLAIVFMASTAGVAGKIFVGHVPWILAIALVAGAVPGAQIGAVVSRRIRVKHLRHILAALVTLAAVKLGLDAFF